VNGAFVVDVNVAIVANGNHESAGAGCRLSCIRALREARGEVVCLDDGDRILGEYRRHLSMGGQPGVGDEFMYWLHHNQHNPSSCERVQITSREEDDQDFMEFPQDADLISFDRSDRKYVAVALASKHRPELLNASDTDWWHFRVPLERNGVRIAL